jgi:signal transduction histidine kinase
VLLDRRVRFEDAIHTFAHRLHRSATLKELIDGAAQDIARAVHARHVHIVIGSDEHLKEAVRAEEGRGSSYRLQVPLGVGERRAGWILLGERRNLYPYFDGEHYFLRISGELLGSAVAAVRRRQVLRADTSPEEARLQQDEQLTELRAELDRLRAQLRDTRERCDPEMAADALALAEEQGARDPAAGLRIVGSLRRVLQHGIERNGAPSTLGKEMAFARELLALEKLRLRNRLDVDLGYDLSLQDQAVPHGVLLPLLDNAFQHGLRRELRVGWVRVRAARDGQAVEITVEDNGAGMDPSRIELEGRGGLARALSSLRALFGEASALRVESREDEPGTRVRVRVPLRFVEGRAASAAHA